MIPTQIKNIIFDFGGVLFDIDYHAPVRAFRALGLDRFEEIYSQAAQRPEFDLLETGKIDNESFMQFLHSFVPHASRKEVDDAWNCILLQLWPEKVALVKSLRDQGYRTFLLSNTNAIHVAEFEKMIDAAMGLSDFRSAFEKVYYSNEIGIKKPYPQTFLTVCEWNNLIPGETMFIDDSKQHVDGAAAAGLVAVHLTPEMKLEELFR
jgi:glucose-1-phosphatase